MSHVEFSKNTENYFVVKVDGEEVQDRDGLCRPYWRCTEKVCPFPQCTEKAWNRVKSDLWSVESKDCVISYLKQHGMESGLHGGSKHHLDVVLFSENNIDAIVLAADIEESIDTYQDRMAYKTQKNLQSDRKRKREKHDDADQWHSSKGGSSSNWQSESSDSKAILQNLSTLAQNVATLVAAKSPGAEAPAMPAVTKALMTGPTSSELQAVPHFIDSAIRSAQELDNGATLRCNEKMVSVSFSTLVLCKETTKRSEEACKQALASMLTPMNQLRVECGVLSNSEAVLDPIIASAKNS